jgi:cell wall assembly regulator SMI1
MKAVWGRIHAWHDANAPTGYGDLRPGASEEAIRAAEDALGLNLPDDVEASYLIHDGQGPEPGLLGGEGWRLLSLEEIVGVWSRWFGSDPEVRHRVPIAWGERNDYVFLDLDPDSDAPGCLMIQRSDCSEPHPFMPSFSSWLADFADRLEDGEFAYSEDHGCVMYADESDLD